MVLLFPVEWHLEQAGSHEEYDEAKQRHVDVRQQWNGAFGLVEQKRNGQVPCEVLMIIVRNLCIFEWHCDSPVWELGLLFLNAFLFHPVPSFSVFSVASTTSA